METTPEVTKDLETIANLKVSAEVRAWMARRDLKQIWLAEILGIGQSAVSKRLRGALPFTAPELLLIATALELSLGELLGGLAHEKSPHPVGEGLGSSTGAGVAVAGLDPATSRL